MVVARRFLIGSRVPPSRLPLLYFRPARTTHLPGGVSLTLPGSRLFPVAISPLLSLSRRCCTYFYYDIKGCVEHTLLVKQYKYGFIFSHSMGLHKYLRNATIFCLVIAFYFLPNGRWFVLGVLLRPGSARLCNASTYCLLLYAVLLALYFAPVPRLFA